MSEPTPVIAVNGVLNASLSPLDRGLAYGDGLFETCRVYSGRVPLWQWHRERLSGGCQRLGIPLNETDLLAQREQILEAASRQGMDHGVLKLMVTRGQGGRGYRPPADPEPTLCWVFHPGEKRQWRDHARAGVTVRLCRHRLSDNPLLAGLKHLNRLEYVLARAEWADEYPEGLLLDTRGRVVEGTVSNLFAVSGGQLCTPTLARSGVAGVMRRLLIEHLAPAVSLTVVERDISRQQLNSAEEVFVCNSVFGLWPVIRIIPEAGAFDPGPVTRRLQQTWNDWLYTRLDQEGAG